MNLGTGELVLFSEQRLRVDDLAWHLVELYCVKDHVSLVIDKHYEKTGRITGGMHNLHFQHGIYIAVDLMSHISMDSSPISVAIWRMWCLTRGRFFPLLDLMLVLRKFMRCH